MKNISKKTNSEKLIEQIIDASDKFSRKRTTSLETKAMDGIKAILELLGRSVINTQSQNRKEIKTNVKKQYSNNLLNRIRELRGENLRYCDIVFQLKKEGYKKISISVISNLLVNHRNTVKIKIPGSFNLGQAITYLHGNGYTSRMIVERLNVEGFRTPNNELLTVVFIRQYFSLSNEERDFLYDGFKKTKIQTKNISHSIS